MGCKPKQLISGGRTTPTTDVALSTAKTYAWHADFAPSNTAVSGVATDPPAMHRPAHGRWSKPEADVKCPPARVLKGIKNNIDKVNTPIRIHGMDIHFTLNGESFVWDHAKALKNLRKHGVRFEEAAVFGDPAFVLVTASRHDEAREAAIGFDAVGRLLYVVHIEFEAAYIRIISARRADAQEETQYAV